MAEPHRDEPARPSRSPGEPNDASTAPVQQVDVDRPGLHVRLFGSGMFFRLWLTQVVSATGDWLGLVAITALAARVGGSSPEAAIGFVLAARIAPGFFLGPVAGVLVDRWDRKRVMVACDVGRACVLVTLPFVDTVPGLVVASLVLEVFTLLWAPSKEASVPHLVPSDHLTTANSLSLVAAYGTIPIAGAAFALLAKLAEELLRYDVLDGLRLNQEGLAFYVDSATFLVSAIMISTLALPERPKAERAEASATRLDFGGAIDDLKEGWQFVFINPVARAVNVGLATGLIGGGMLVPLGPVFTRDVLGAGDAGFGLYVAALGLGVALGVVALSALQSRLNKARVFTFSVFGAGVSLFVAASSATLVSAAVAVIVLGLCAGSVYVLGFTLLHESVADELRGRIFSALYTLVRFCVLLSFAVGPFLSELLGRLSETWFDSDIEVAGLLVAIPGVRLTLWLAALIIVGAGFLALRSLRPAWRDDAVMPSDP